MRFEFGGLVWYNIYVLKEGRNTMNTFTVYTREGLVEIELSPYSLDSQQQLKGLVEELLDLLNVSLDTLTSALDGSGINYSVTE